MKTKEFAYVLEESDDLYNVFEHDDYVYYESNNKKYKNLSFSLAYELYRVNPKDRTIYLVNHNGKDIKPRQLTDDQINKLVKELNKILEACGIAGSVMELKRVKDSTDKTTILSKNEKNASISQEKEYVLDRLRKFADKIRELETQIDNLGYYIADDDDFSKKDTQ